ncbi:putative sulfate exporter family transporter [Clostridium sp.]|uniref:YeiH family protein n=1 Tax=Clostridium sp. TaxID=1506 RepID=UPI002FC77E16
MSLLKLKNDLNEILPGLIMCIIIAYISKLIGSYVPMIGGATLSILFGIFTGNTLGKNKVYGKGTKFCESNLLSYSIVLLGGTLSIGTILKLGLSGLGYIVIQMIITIAVSIYLGKKFGFSENFSLLMASGNAVCGSSAIAATAPAIGADDKDKGIAITIVNLVGTILMLLLPLISYLLFSFETLKTSALIGGVLQSVGQVVASGALVNEEIKDLATIFKIVRVIFLVFVVLSFSAMKNHSNKKISENTIEHKKAKITVPWYVIGFFITCALFSLNIIPASISKIFKLISSNFEIIALAGIGMRVNFSALLKQGVKTSLYGLSISALQIISALILITILI